MYCSLRLYLFFFFFFQAEDGIRDLIVTGVQTCALPILITDSILDATSEDRIALGSSRGAVAYVALTIADRKSTRLNSSHDQISYAVFCLKKKKQRQHSLRQ